MDELLSDFLMETGESLDRLDVDLVRFEQEPENVEMLNAIFRLMHTIKGTCGFLGLDRLAKLTHAAETLMGEYRDGARVTPEGVTAILNVIDRIKEILDGLERSGHEPHGADVDLIGRLEELAAQPEHGRARTAEHEGSRPAGKPEEAVAEEPTLEDINGAADARLGQSVRVSIKTLEHLMTTVSELVLTRNQLLDIVRRNGESEFKLPLQRLSTVTAELQESVMKARMQPISTAWQKLPRLARELSLALDKKIEIELAGGETELDRQVLDLIKDPLTHMVRNAAGHGLESPAERLKAGKAPVGRIVLNAAQEGGFILIEISDDGRGLSAQKIRAKAVELGLATYAELGRLSEADLYDFIFRPGFSTATEVTGLSGRGVGMDVVRANIEAIGGNVALKSTSPQGTSFLIKIPLTLAIMAALIVSAGGHRFAIPQFSVVELVRAGGSSEHHLETINQTHLLRLRERLLPLVDLAELLELKGSVRGPGEALTVVLIQSGAKLFGMVVDAVFHSEEIVVKPMSQLLRDVSMFSGNTILGDGGVIMILDPNSLGAAAGSLEMEAEKPSAPRAEVKQEKTTPLLLFRAGSQAAKAVPLSLITRLEEIDLATIERCNGRDVVQYRGSLMPLIYVEGMATERKSGVQTVLVLTEESQPVGLAVDAIIDIAEEPLNIELAGDVPGIVGASVIKGKATEIIDVSHYLGKLGGEVLRKGRRQREQIKVLLVEDSPFFRNMLVPLLSARGYEVTVAGSAGEALELKEQNEIFDLIISDLELPGMDGIAFAEAIKSDRLWASTPLIALTSHGGKAVVERARAAGFATHIGKFDRETLMRALDDHCRQSGLAA